MMAAFRGRRGLNEEHSRLSRLAGRLLSGSVNMGGQLVSENARAPPEKINKIHPGISLTLRMMEPTRPAGETQQIELDRCPPRDRIHVHNHTDGHALQRSQVSCVTVSLGGFENFSHRLQLPAGGCVTEMRPVVSSDRAKSFGQLPVCFLAATGSAVSEVIRVQLVALQDRAAGCNMYDRYMAWRACSVGVMYKGEDC